RGDGSRQPGKVRWKLAILTFLSARPETGAGRRDIAEYCLGLIRAGTLVTAAPADDRPRVNKIISLYLYTMKKAREVVRAQDKASSPPARGGAGRERPPAPAADIRQPDEPAPTGKPESRGRTIAIGDIHGCSAALRALLEVVAV